MRFHGMQERDELFLGSEVEVEKIEKNGVLAMGEKICWESNR